MVVPVFFLLYKSSMPDRNKSRKTALRELGINVLLCIASVGLFLGGAELLARLWYAPEQIESQKDFEYDREKFFRWKRNLRSEYRGVPFSTNSFGYRTPEISVEKPKNTKRILILGDSVSMGFALRDHESYPRFLEEDLNNHFAKQGEQQTIQVFNAATPGNATFQEYHDLKRNLQFDPDIIILQFTLNDVVPSHDESIYQLLHEADLTHIENKFAQFQDYLWGKKKLPRLFSIDYRLRQHSALYLFLKDVYSRMQFGDTTGNNIVANAQKKEIVLVRDLVSKPTNPEIEESWKTTLGLMREMTNLANQRGIPFIILATPWDFQMERTTQSAHPQNILKKFAQEQHVLYIDILEQMQTEFALSRVGEETNPETIARVISETSQSNPSALREYWYALFQDFCHPTIEGHRFIAKAIQPVVLDTLRKTKE
ncbi:hypothetical protein COU79_01300 [Candidatus Peregrinibacteria bacterium CG10_big_fil_rev_8_21_14_0_10_54_7]|nr:MAG: hypothetical protein COU79_01300 [Candidatus Peregrinibacteria bacterium CG10_big_fil_rev_8_21_14_0_10_54_7]